jgi:uncharacterized protein DUF6603
VALRKGSRRIASVTLKGTLSGPNPWHAKGEACVSVLFLDVCVGFNVTLSERKPEPIPPPQDVVARLTAALADPRNWTAELPVAAHQAVSLVVSPADRAAVLLDPAGGVVVRQRVVPLDQPIQRFETFKIPKGAPSVFRLTGVKLGGGAVDERDLARVTDFFARGQFEDLPDAKKLSLSAFEQMPAGVRILGGQTDTRGWVTCDASYRTFVVESSGAEPREATDDPYVPTAERTARLARRSPMAVGGLASSGTDKFATRKRVVASALGPEPFTIASVGELVARPDLVKPVQDLLGFVTKARAFELLAQHLDSNPSDRGKLQVVPQIELPMAA